jgi:hypothetical protein
MQATGPIFIVGFQRSGTTLLRLMLDAHPVIAIPLDTVGLWSRWEERLDRYGDLGTAINRQRLVTDLTADERIRLWEPALSPSVVLALWSDASFPGLIDAFYRAYAQSHGKSRWGEKDPGNMLRIPRLAHWFPKAQFIHIIRDGRDACLSQVEQDFGFNDVLPCAEAWREQVWWVRNLGAILGHLRYHELRFEDLVAAPEAQLRGICDFLGVPFSKDMLLYHQNVEAAVPASKRHLWPMLTKPPQKSNTERWKTRMTRAQRLCFEKRAQSVLREMGYETLKEKPAGGYLVEFGSLLRRLRGSLIARSRRSS